MMVGVLIHIFCHYNKKGKEIKKSEYVDRVVGSIASSIVGVTIC